MGITRKKYLEIREEYGKCSSWAIWAEKEKGKCKERSNMDDLSVLDPTPKLLKKLKPNIVLVGLNVSKEIKEQEPFSNFHPLTSQRNSNDYKIRYALNKKRFWGAYMTDIIKDVPETNSKLLMKNMSKKEKEKEEEKNTRDFEKELNFIGSKNPFIIVFGGKAYSILNRYLDKRFKNNLKKITHYSHFISQENLKKRWENEMR